jgi:hypothetical protein
MLVKSYRWNDQVRFPHVAQSKMVEGILSKKQLGARHSSVLFLEFGHSGLGVRGETQENYGDSGMGRIFVDLSCEPREVG